MSAERTAIATCPLCEATCGLEITLDGDRVVKARGDDADVFSKGFICPKGGSIGALHHDPDRLAAPLVRGDDGELHEATWDEAFAAVERKLAPILAEHGRDSVAVYLGNPSAHNLAAQLYGRVVLKALGSKNVYSASTVDQMPKQVSAGLMFGGGLSVPVPDLDRTDHLLILGANPLQSNGSLMTSPDVRGKLRAIRERGGKVVVIDPRLTRTAEQADEHHFIRPGTDALLLAAMTRTLLDEGLADAGALASLCNGLEELPALVEPYTPDGVAIQTGIDAETIRRLARELAAAPTAAVYGRIGTCTQEFGTLASWLVDVLNILTGNLDREGGAMFPLAAAGQSNSSGSDGSGKGIRFGRWSSRVSEHPETFGEFPVACLAEEITTSGDGQIRALITVAGNPCLSTPDAGALDAAISSLDAVVCLDVYVNETTRHADVILPGPTPLERSHYDLALYQLAVRNVANYSAPVLDAPDGLPQEWETLLRLTGVVSGQGSDADVAAIDAFVARQLVDREVGTAGSRLHGRDPEEIMGMLEPRVGPERLLDLLLRSGAYGDRFGEDADGLTLAKLEANPHGIDFGPLTPRLPAALRTASGKIEVAPAELMTDLPRLEAALDAPAPNGGFVLVGRRHLRSNNSWMHNIEPLVKGKDRCTLHVHPADADRLGLVEGSSAHISSAAGQIDAPVEITADIMRGVVSLPHGWGHDVDGVRMDVARRHAGVNANVLTDSSAIDVPSGNAVLNGIPVEVVPVAAAEPAVVAG
jgi:anaerobic selenocysteine-containing dehydrogenase